MRLRAVDVQGVPHVSLPEFIDQCGGYCRVDPARVSADLFGRSVVVGVNDTKVYSSRESFALAHPVIRHRGEVLIAVDDLDVLLAQGFAARIKRPGVVPEGRETGQEPLPDIPDEALSPGRRLTVSTESTDIPAPEPLNTRRVGTGAAAIQTVIIDPGHGGSDPGYVSAAGLSEKDLSLAVALALRRILKETTVLKSYLTRSDDSTVSPRDRSNLARRVRGDLFVSIHAAVSMSETAEGFGIYYAPSTARAEVMSRIRRRRPGLFFTNTDRDNHARSMRAARALETSIAAASGVSEHWVRGVPVAILRDAGMPGVLVEVGHLTNPAETALLESRSQQEKIARGIAEGIAAMVGDVAMPGVQP